MDYYKTLGLEKTASAEDIKSAYRKLAKEYHPDRNPGDPTAEAKFKEVQEAYDILSDAHKRAQFDAGTFRHTSARPNPGSPPPFSNIWDSVFGHAPPAAKERGRNIQVSIELTLNEVMTGVTKKIQVPRRERCSKCEATGYTDHKPCATCHGSGKTVLKQSPFNISIGCGACRGTGRAGVINCDACKGEGFITTSTYEVPVNIPHGIETGHQLRVAGYGEPPRKPVGKAGDLHIIVCVKEHKLFKRHGSNLSYDLPVGMTELCFGGTIDIPVVNGNVSLTIPPNTANATQFRLKGLGLPTFHGIKGDLVVTVKLNTPSKEIVETNKETFDKLALLEKEYIKKVREKLL